MLNDLKLTIQDGTGWRTMVGDDVKWRGMEWDIVRDGERSGSTDPVRDWGLLI